jgi:hypothetical protein
VLKINATEEQATKLIAAMTSAGFTVDAFARYEATTEGSVFTGLDIISITRVK